MKQALSSMKLHENKMPWVTSDANRSYHSLVFKQLLKDLTLFLCLFCTMEMCVPRQMNNYNSRC